MTLYHASFAFTSAWRSLITDARGEGVRAQMLMLALATTVFIPVLNAGTLLGQPVGGAVAPPFFGWIADIGRPEFIFWASGAVTVMCIVSVYAAAMARRGTDRTRNSGRRS